jgi:hypothetical protein
MHGILVGSLPKEGIFPRLATDCSLWEGLSFSTVSWTLKRPAVF